MSSYQVAAIAANIARKTQGFVPANGRPACSNCQHGVESREDRMPPYDTQSWRCTLGGFRVTAKAICNSYTDKKGGAR